MPEFSRRFLSLLVRAIIALGFLMPNPGCGKPAAIPKLVPVVGNVYLDGKPLAGGTVSFRPDAAKGNSVKHEPAGEIDDQGNYTLFTAGKEGAPPGWYKVAVVANEPPDAQSADPYAPGKSRIPAHYRNIATSDLIIEVVEKPDANAYDLPLKSKK
jgi:hypothetical protein